jgi:23S rRNA (guanine745-N1)-methyltransferase
LDGSPLDVAAGRLLCAHGHSFDIARQGYANLLSVQHKRSRAPGDSQAMVAARAAFLDSGVYAPVAERLVALAAAGLPTDRPAVVLDAGCGEGYYLACLQHVLAKEPGPAARLVGIDISKPAIIAAARRSRAITWLVASNARPPLLPGSVDLVICAFGFPSYRALHETLRPGGRLLLVDPGPDHLLELRQVIYPSVRRRAVAGLDEAQRLGFRLMHSETLSFRTERLDAEMLRHLLVMTPHLYRASAEGRQAAAAIDSLALTVDLVFRTLVCEPRSPDHSESPNDAG